jgi:hypothetical protein
VPGRPHSMVFLLLNVGVAEELKGEGKIVNNDEVYHICVETSHNRKLLNNTRWKKSVKKCSGVGLN